MRMCDATSILAFVHETVTLLSIMRMATGIWLCNATSILGNVHETVTLLYIT
jgi:hypothetical protein